MRTILTYYSFKSRRWWIFLALSPLEADDDQGEGADKDGDALEVGEEVAGDGAERPVTYVHKVKKGFL